MREDISTIPLLIKTVQSDYFSWKTNSKPWFRGEPISDTPLLPKLYRKKSNNEYHNENQLNQYFRMKAPILYRGVPDRNYTAEWLFLMQHVGLPTRLLDWTEGLLIALYFALQSENPVIWMLNPVALNNLSLNGMAKFGANEFPLYWTQPKGEINIGNINIRGAWEEDKVGTELPVAIHPTNVHQRMFTQKSCFTIHGINKSSICDLVPDEILKKYLISPNKKEELIYDLKFLGISQSSIFPDLDGLAKELDLEF